MASILDVSSFILEEFGEMSTMKLQKLAYYCQAYSLSEMDEVLFAEDFKAWANGPVCSELFSQHRGRFSIANIPGGSSSNLKPNEKSLIETVCSVFAEYTGRDLSERTHNEQPWKDARGSLPLDARSTNTITKNAMKHFYTQKPLLRSGSF